MTANRKVTARYAEIARFLGLHFNEEFCVAYGEKDGFTLRVSGLDTGRGFRNRIRHAALNKCPHQDHKK